jgi:hypothetical protein
MSAASGSFSRSASPVKSSTVPNSIVYSNSPHSSHSSLATHEKQTWLLGSADEPLVAVREVVELPIMAGQRKPQSTQLHLQPSHPRHWENSTRPSRERKHSRNN